MPHKYKTVPELDELSGDDSVIDYACLTDDNFFLVCLLCAKGDVQVFYEVGQDRPRKRVLNIPTLWGRPIEPVAICMGPDASFLALALSDGDVLLVPMKVLLDVTWGSRSPYIENTPVLVPVTSSADFVLRTPTCLRCFTSKHSLAPVLLSSNKAGQVLIIDLLTKKLTIEVQAPESIHRLDVFSSSYNVDLLVTGFTGVQWVVPLESTDRGLRETLGVLIPSDLKALEPNLCHVSPCGDMVLRLDPRESTAQLFPSIRSLCSPLNVPFGDSTVNVTTFNVRPSTHFLSIGIKAVFSLPIQGCPSLKYRFGTKLDRETGVAYASWHEVKEEMEWKNLGLIGLRETTTSMPQCFVVYERGLSRLLPAQSDMSVEHWLSHSLQLYNFPRPNELKEAIDTFRGVPYDEWITNLLNFNLGLIAKDPGYYQGLLVKTVTIAKNHNMSFDDLMSLMEKHGLDYLLLPQIELRVNANPKDSSKKHVISMYVKNVEAGVRSDRLADDSLCCFLCRHPDVDGVDSMSDILRVRLYRSAALLISRNPSNSQPVLSFLISRGLQLFKDGDSITRSELLCLVWPLKWDILPTAEVTSFLSILTTWQPLILGDTCSHTKSARVAALNMERSSPTSRILFIVSSLLASSSSPSLPLSSPQQLISSGLNSSFAYCIDRRLFFWGELNSVQPRTVESEILADPSSPSPTRKSARRAPDTRGALTMTGVDVHSMSVGAEHVLIVTSDGRLVSKGKNRFGQCGLGHTDNVDKPTEVEGDWSSVQSLSAGQLHSALLLNDGLSLFTWGWGFYGQLGHSNASDRSANVLTPVRVHQIPEKSVTVSCGRVHTLLLGESGRVWVVGGGAYGQHGTKMDTMKSFGWSQVDLGMGVGSVVRLETRFYHSLALTEDNRLFEWGKNPQELKMKMFVMRRLRNVQDKNKEGEKNAKVPLPMTVPKDFLGVREVEHSVKEKIIAISTGLSHSALITQEGELYTWGKGLDMQLGHGNKTEKSEPTKVTEPEGMTWTTVHCGGNHTIASSFDGRLWAWGRNDVGQCGIPSHKSTNSPRKYFFQAKEGSKRCVQLADDSSFVPLPTLIPSISLHQPAASADMDRVELVSSVRSLDPCNLRLCSRYLSSLSLPSSSAIHLLAGDVSTAISCLGYSEHSAQETPTALISLVWDILANHVDCQTRPLLSSAFSLLPRTHSTVANRQLQALWPGVWEDEEGREGGGERVTRMGGEGLNVEERMKMISAWNPPAVNPSQVILSSSSLSGSGRGRVFPLCGHVADSSSSLDSCTVCIDEWKSTVRETFS